MVSVGLQMTSDCRAQARQGAQFWIRMSGLAGWAALLGQDEISEDPDRQWRDVMARSLLVPAQDPWGRGDDVG